jgi:hypothetical protein
VTARRRAADDTYGATSTHMLTAYLCRSYVAHGESSDRPAA